MTKNYRIKRHYTIVFHSPDSVEFRFGVWNPTSYNVNDSTNSGKVAKLVKLLDGTNSSKEIAKLANVSRAEVEGLIDHLLSLNVIEDQSNSGLDAYIDQIQMPFYRSEPIISEDTPILMLGSEHLQKKVIEQIEPSIKPHWCSKEQWEILIDPDIAWLGDGLKFQERLESFLDWKGHFIVAVMDTINPLAFKVLNKILYELDCSWIHAALDGPFIFIGPTFVPSNTSCYSCLEKRILMNIREADNYVKYKNLLSLNQVKKGERLLSNTIDGILGAYTAFEIMNLSKTGNSFTRNKMMAIYLPTMEVTFNEVLKVPGCTVCGSSLEKDHFEMHFDMSSVLVNS